MKIAVTCTPSKMAASMQTMLSVLSSDLLKGSASSGEYGHYVDILREHQLFSVEVSDAWFVQ